MSKVNIVPLGDRVLVEPTGIDEKTPAGIIIPDSSTEKNKGKVIAVGDLEEIKNIKVGDTVLFGYSYEIVKSDEKEYYVIQSKDLFAIVK